MGTRTKIEWCDHTFNPWIGCAKIAPECANCYAAARDAWLNEGRWGPRAPRHRTSAANWRAPLKWDRDAGRRGVVETLFCASLADVCEDRRDLDAYRADLFRLIDQTEHLHWLILTKRPEHAPDMIPRALHGDPRIWLGTTAGTQESADTRIPHLLAAPAAVHFASCEPLLEPVDLSRFLRLQAWSPDQSPDGTGEVRVRQPLDWVIVGGESGRRARPMDLLWARDIVSQCAEAKVACFVKQLGARPELVGDHVALRDSKGGDPDEWPEGLRVRQFPRVEGFTHAV